MEVLQCYSKIVQNILNFAPIWTTVLHENFGATDLHKYEGFTFPFLIIMRGP